MYKHRNTNGEKLDLIVKQIQTVVKFVLSYYLSSDGFLGSGKMAGWSRAFVEYPMEVISNHDRRLTAIHNSSFRKSSDLF